MLIVGAGVSYYYARKAINNRRDQQAAQGIRPPDIRDCDCSILFFLYLALITLCLGKQRIQVEHEDQPAPQPRNKDNTHSYTKRPPPDETYRAAAEK